MTVTGTTALTNEVKPLYDGDFLMACQAQLYHEPVANLRMVMGDRRGVDYRWPMVENLPPSATALTELEDVTPQSMNANELVVTLQEFGGAIQVTKFLDSTSYSDVLQQAAYNNGYNMAESIDFVVRRTMGQGGRQIFQNNRTARNTIVGQSTAADRLTTAFLERLAVVFSRSIRMPLFDDGFILTIMHPFVFYDLLQTSDIRNVAQRVAPEMLFNGEVAAWGGVRIIQSANAKGFWGSGGANVASSLATTLSIAGAVGDATLTLTAAAAAGNIGQWFAVQDASEPANTWSDTNELFRVTGVSGSTVTGFCLDPGPGDSGGLRYAHAALTTFTNANSVYPLVCVGPNSITKIASEVTGPYGETVVTGPFDYLGRFLTVGWYALLGYARTRTGWIVRGECGSLEA